jgi:hypothetical protein
MGRKILKAVGSEDLNALTDLVVEARNSTGFGLSRFWLRDFSLNERESLFTERFLPEFNARVAWALVDVEFRCGQSMGH